MSLTATYTSSSRPHTLVVEASYKTETEADVKSEGSGDDRPSGLVEPSVEPSVEP
jgi:hypothetical protein